MNLICILYCIQSCLGYRHAAVNDWLLYLWSKNAPVRGLTSVLCKTHLVGTWRECWLVLQQGEVFLADQTTGRRLVFTTVDRVYHRHLPLSLSPSPKCITHVIHYLYISPSSRPHTPFLIPYTHLSPAPGENRGHFATSHLPSPRAVWLGKISAVGLTFSPPPPLFLTLSLHSLLH